MSKKISYQSQRDCLHVCLILIILFSFAYYEAERKNSVSPPEENQITTTDSITPDLSTVIEYYSPAFKASKGLRMIVFQLLIQTSKAIQTNIPDTVYIFYLIPKRDFFRTSFPLYHKKDDKITDGNK